MADVITIRTRGYTFRGWNTARVTRSLETMCGTFSLAVADRWDGDLKPWPVREGDACEIDVNGRTLITGYVDSRELAFDETSRSISLAGRDRAGDLVDCSVVLPSWEFSDVAVFTLAQKICEPFGVRVSLQPGLTLSNVGLLKKHSIDPGDTAQSALENLCRAAGVLLISDGRGGIMLTRNGVARATTALEQGKNVKSARASFDFSSRFGEYRVLGSHKGRDDISGAAAAGVKGDAVDVGVRSERVCVVRPEGNVTPATAAVRAQWEAAVRAARSETVTVTVQGWTQADGSLWDLNTLARVKIPAVGVDGEMLIAGLTFALDLSGGTTTEITLKGPRAYVPDPTLGKVPAGNNYWKEIVRGV